jgi:hypothetical protein
MVVHGAHVCGTIAVRRWSTCGVWQRCEGTAFVRRVGPWCRRLERGRSRLVFPVVHSIRVAPGGGRRPLVVSASVGVAALSDVSRAAARTRGGPVIHAPCGGAGALRRRCRVRQAPCRAPLRRGRRGRPVARGGPGRPAVGAAMASCARGVMFAVAAVAQTGGCLAAASGPPRRSRARWQGSA